MFTISARNLLPQLSGNRQEHFLRKYTLLLRTNLLFMMRIYPLLTLLFLSLFCGSLNAQNFDDEYPQSFEDGLELYNNEQYEQAAQIFKSLSDDRSLLFTGKSYFAMSDYITANSFLIRLRNSDETALRQEAKYTEALSNFRLKNYTKSLDLLHELIEAESRTGVQVDARRYYRQLLRYLSVEERFKAIHQTEYRTVQLDLAASARATTDPGVYDILVAQILKSEQDSTVKENLKNELYSRQQNLNRVQTYPVPPEGMVYNIGVILPTFDVDSQEFTIPRNLYFGITHAVEEFNSRNSSKKVHLTFKPSRENPDTAGIALTELIWANQVDAVIGPLFSEPAKKMAEISEQFRIPMLAPLANADDINLDYNYTFQLNPTFEVHGKQMARYAVNELRLDTLAVIAQHNALGTSSAQAFRHEAERLGAFISYYIEEDFGALGYDLTELTEVFTADEALIDSLNITPSNGIYAPFTGQAASTLINLLMTDLEVLGNRSVILGSEEWESASLSAWQNRNFEIYYSQAFGTAADSTTVEFMELDFESRFGIKPDQFANIGYDAATVLLNSLETAGNPAYLGKVLRERQNYNGLSMRVHFDGHRINQNVYIRPLSTPAIERVERSERLRRYR